MTAEQPEPVPRLDFASSPSSLETAGEVTFKLDGTFDGASAWELRHAIESLRSGARIVLDFTGVRDFSDFGVAVLAYGLAQRPPTSARIALRGLRAHQLKMFRYFGVDAG